MKKPSLIILILCCTCLLACGESNESKNPAETVTPEATVTSMLAPTNKPTETLAPTATNTPIPTNTPTNTPKPTATATPLPKATNTPTPTPTKAPIVVELPDDIYSFQIALDNDVYQFPMWIDDFEAMGWKYAEKETGELKPDYYTSAYWEKEGLKCYSKIFNFTVNTLPYNQCAIAGIKLDKYDLGKTGITVTLPKGIQTGVATKEDILAAYGVPSSEYEGSLYFQMEYQYDTYQTIKLYVYKETGVLEAVDISNITELEGGNNEVSYAIPDYVLNYQAPDSTEDTNYEMIFTLGGEMYKLPCPVSELVKNGFYVDLEKSNEYLASFKSGEAVLTKGNVSLTCEVTNFAKYAAYIQNCFITEIESDTYSNKNDLCMLGNIKVGSTENDVLDVIAGLNYTKKEMSSGTSYTVFAPETSDYDCRYYIYCTDGVVSSMELKNRNTPKNGEGKQTEFVSDPLPTEKEEEGIYSYQITINGDLYQFPMWFSEFEALGWTFKEDAAEKLAPNTYTSAQVWEKDGVRIYTTLYNLTINTATLSQCAVAGIEIDRYQVGDNKIALELPFEIEFGVSTKEDIIAAYGVPTREYDSDTYWVLTYKKDNYEFVELTVDKDIGVLRSIEIENMIELEGGNNEVSFIVPDCVKNYSQPKELGTNFYDMVFELDGVLYSMPCPVSLLLENGFSLNKESDGMVVAAESTVYATFIYKNNSMRCLVTNQSEQATTIENCFLTSIKSSDNAVKLNMTLSGNLRRGSSQEDLLKVIEGLNYEKYESSATSVSYTIWNSEVRRGNNCTIYVSNGVITSIEMTNYILKE